MRIGLRGEDTGILACQQLDNNDIIGYVDVVVYGKALYLLPLLCFILQVVQSRGVRDYSHLLYLGLH